MLATFCACAQPAPSIGVAELRVRQDVAGLSGLKIIQETVSWASAASAQAFTLLGFQPVAERVSVLRENVVKAPYLAAF